jgi:hypothetical protein
MPPLCSSNWPLEALALLCSGQWATVLGAFRVARIHRELVARKQRFLARRAQETEQWRDLFNAETGAETT